MTARVALRETCRVVGAGVPLWPYHRARLASAGCSEAVLAEAERAMRDAIAGWDGPASSRTRLTLVVAPDGAVQVAVQRRLSSLDVPGGPRLAVVRVSAPPRLPKGAAKPADRSYWDDGQRAARAAGGDIALLVDGDDRVIDGGTSTVWLARGGALATPPAPPAVAGVARAFLLDRLATAGTPARVDVVTIEDVERADEVFLTNAFGGAVCVRGRGPGPVFGQVAAVFDEMWRG